MEQEYWMFEGANGEWHEIEDYLLTFTPSNRTNLLGRPLEWGAALTDSQCRALASIADGDGCGLSLEWGVFMCPCKLWAQEKLLVVDTSATW